MAIARIYFAYEKAVISAREKNGFGVKFHEEAELHRYKRTLNGGNAARRTLAGSNGKES